MNLANKSEKDNFQFEIEGEDNKNLPEIEIEDDTPEQDRNRTPMPEEIVRELENDEMEEYSEKVKTRLKQMKKVWHDERREKERALREQQEAINFAKKMAEENKFLKNTLHKGEVTLVDTYRQAAELELNDAKRKYKEAYEAGDPDLLLEAQEKLNSVGYKIEQAKNFKPTPLQENEISVNNPQEVVQRPQLDEKTIAWQKRNKWWGDPEYPEMTALALGTHQKLENQYGKQYIGTDEYWRSIDNTMKQRFPEMFEEEVKTKTGGGKPGSRAESNRPATVVAPASRSTSSNKVKLTASQVSLAKKLGLTPEQYAREQQKINLNTEK
jgi:G:T/U-mismatch repair DNA glycosylase